jgi:hypoxanthine phosphoribosyltransferase
MLCPIPDSAGSNRQNADTLSEWLNNMEVVECISKNPDENRTVTEARSREERRDVLQNKFLFNYDRMPKVGNVLIYDDKVSSGDTIDRVVQEMKRRAPELEVVALVQFVYTGRKVSSPAVRRLVAAKSGVEIEEQAALT